MNPYLLGKAKSKNLNSLGISVHYTAEADEFWSYAGSKDTQRWTGYAMDKSSGIMLAWVNGRRTDNSFKKLLDLLKDTPIGQYYTDDWVAYSKAFAKQ